METVLEVGDELTAAMPMPEPIKGFCARLADGDYGELLAAITGTSRGRAAVICGLMVRPACGVDGDGWCAHNADPTSVLWKDMRRGCHELAKACASRA